MLGEQIESLLKAGRLSDEELNLLMRALEAMHVQKISRRLRGAMRTMKAGPGGLDEEDFIQEMWRRVTPILKGGEAREVEQVERWLLKIAMRCLIDYMRKSRPEAVNLPFSELYTNERARNPAEIAASREEDKILREAVESLAWPLRDVVESYTLEGQSFAEIARVLGIPRGRVVRRYQRAIALLQTKLGGRIERC